MSTTQPAAQRKGLEAQVAAVRAARERLGQDIDLLDAEVRTKVRKTVQDTLWKAVVTAAGIGAAIGARKGLAAAWKAGVKTDPPANPADPDTTWPEAIGWTIATGVAVGVARLLANRGAAAGWRRTVGELPPPLRKGDQHTV